MQFLSLRCRGIGLLELMLTLIVIAAILFLVTRYYNITQESLRVEKAVTMSTNIVNGTHQWAETVTSISPISIQKLIDADLVPASYANGNPWGGDLEVYAPAFPGDYFFTVYMSGIPAAASCENLREKMQKYAYDPANPYNPAPIPPCILQGNNKYAITMWFKR